MNPSEKKALQQEEKRRRMVNSGVPEEQVDARIAKEKYDHLPVDKKIRMLEQMVASSFTQVAQDILALRHTEGLLIDSLDVNAKVITKLFVKLGISTETIKALTEEAFNEIQLEKERLELAKAKVKEKKEEDQLVSEVDKAAPPDTAPVIPEGASVFGG